MTKKAATFCNLLKINHVLDKHKKNIESRLRKFLAKRFRIVCGGVDYACDTFHTWFGYFLTRNA